MIRSAKGLVGGTAAHPRFIIKTYSGKYYCNADCILNNYSILTMTRYLLGFHCVERWRRRKLATLVPFEFSGGDNDLPTF